MKASEKYKFHIELKKWYLEAISQADLPF